ncbi:uncharacterized protein EV420DRAFT_1676587 [Desarmillaria tabescens]|uniref:Uncharacterized protein n=1 Tax=Armillaria tabescens TaxID=1929756 RepID=A0AA39J3I8_ARMTA|nr:uncharacterized protein EV420DRAFT_1676587 [Desarmillaria tabescens]KAK0435460.1 hypothetical protein EV420DRAFT_1676587 [Desarmillaria tabescens]
MLARYFGDVAKAKDVSQGTVWGDCNWLDGKVPAVHPDVVWASYFLQLIHVPHQEEESLAAVYGMNCFVAYVILCQIMAEEFLDLLPQERIDKFGILVMSEGGKLLSRLMLNRMDSQQIIAGVLAQS